MKKLCFALWLAATSLYLPRLEAAKKPPDCAPGNTICAECSTNADCVAICGGCAGAVCFSSARACGLFPPTICSCAAH